MTVERIETDEERRERLHRMLKHADLVQEDIAETLRRVTDSRVRTDRRLRRLGLLPPAESKA